MFTFAQNRDMKIEEQSTANLQNEGVAPYKQGLICGANLQGVYCLFMDKFSDEG